jgi:hygromycin-B 4-O-kinase
VSEHPDDFARDAYAARISSPLLPIPRVTHRGTIDGSYYAVSQRVHGEFIDNLSAEDLRRTLPSLTRTLDALRTSNVDNSTGYGGWDENGNGSHESWPDFLLESLQDSPTYRGGGWRSLLESSPTGATSFDRDLAVFARRVDDLPSVRHVIHTDLLNFNAFVADNTMSGIIDWGCAMYGDFVYELAWFRFWWPWYPQWSNIDVVAAAVDLYRNVGADLAGLRERIMVYQLHIGLGHQFYHASIGNWDMLEAVTRHTAAIADELR